MADRGIPFSAPMVSALLAGTKTQTRRGLKNPEYYGCPTGDCPHDKQAECDAHMAQLTDKEKGYAVGDRLYVRETYYQRGHWAPVETQRTKAGRQKWAFIPADDVILFEAPGEFRKGRHHKDPATVAWHKRLGRFMPRRYSRLTLIVTDVRVERLQDISEADAIAEGCIWDDAKRGYWVPGVEHPMKDFPYLARATAREMYAALWDTINGSGEWLANPWVAAIAFDCREGNIDG